MSINLIIHYPNSQDREHDFYPFSSVGENSMWIRYWKPMVIEHHLQWLILMETAGIGFYSYLDQLDKIRSEFQILYDLTKALINIDLDFKERMLSRISMVLQVIDKIETKPSQFRQVSIG